MHTSVVVGVDGAGRSHRLDEIAAAATGPVSRVTGAAEPAEADLEPLLRAADGGLLVVDDAHRLGEAALRRLAAAARAGQPMVISRRPQVHSAALATLDELVAGQGAVQRLGPLSDEQLAALIARVTGAPASQEQVAEVRTGSAGVAVVAAALAGALGSGTDRAASAPPADLVARVQRRLALLDPPAADLARLLAMRLNLPDQVLAAAVGLSPQQCSQALAELSDQGFLVPGGEQMIPALAQAVLADLGGPQRRRLHDAVAQAMIDNGADAVAAAEQLRAARARTAVAAQLYAAAGDRLRFDDPGAAQRWYDDALAAGAEPASVAAGRAEAAALLGLPVDLDPPSPAEAGRLALVAGAVAAHAGRVDRACDTLLGAAGPGPVLAVPILVAAGRLTEAVDAAAGAGPHPLRRLAEAAPAITEPHTALPLLIEAAEALEQMPPPLVLPDTAHAFGALVAVTAGDCAVAEHLLGRALAAGLGGPVAAERHQILLAWARLRAGRYDTAVEQLRRSDPTGLPGRERLLLAALAAGVARRSGDVARLREAWAVAEPVLARQVVDLVHAEPAEELLVAAARLRQRQRIGPVLATLDGIVDRLGNPSAWRVVVGWIQLQIAVAGEDEAGAATAVDLLRRAGAAGARQRAQCLAAEQWLASLTGQVDPEAVLAATEELVAGQLPWEASRLAGHAAIRTTDPAAARRLLERARALAAPEPGAAGMTAGPAAAGGGLSEREQEVARLVLAGRTHKEIGAQLYLSPKTVEHHVARIRTKLGATNRAELVAALRRVLPDADQ